MAGGEPESHRRRWRRSVTAARRRHHAAARGSDGGWRWRRRRAARAYSRSLRAAAVALLAKLEVAITAHGAPPITWAFTVPCLVLAVCSRAATGHATAAARDQWQRAGFDTREQQCGCVRRRAAPGCAATTSATATHTTATMLRHHRVLCSASARTDAAAAAHHDHRTCAVGHRHGRTATTSKRAPLARARTRAAAALHAPREVQVGTHRADPVAWHEVCVASAAAGAVTELMMRRHAASAPTWRRRAAVWRQCAPVRRRREVVSVVVVEWLVVMVVYLVHRVAAAAACAARMWRRREPKVVWQHAAAATAVACVRRTAHVVLDLVVDVGVHRVHALRCHVRRRLMVDLVMLELMVVWCVHCVVVVDLRAQHCRARRHRSHMVMQQVVVVLLVWRWVTMRRRCHRAAAGHGRHCHADDCCRSRRCGSRRRCAARARSRPAAAAATCASSRRWRRGRRRA